MDQTSPITSVPASNQSSREIWSEPSTAKTCLGSSRRPPRGKSQDGLLRTLSSRESGDNSQLWAASRTCSDMGSDNEECAVVGNTSALSKSYADIRNFCRTGKKGPPSLKDELLVIDEQSAPSDTEYVGQFPSAAESFDGLRNRKPRNASEESARTDVACNQGAATTSAETKDNFTSASPSKADANVHMAASEGSAGSSLWEYLSHELQPKPTVAVADPVWGATERDVMYNSLIFVPYQLERIMWFGLAVCFDPFLASFTTVPLRALKAIADFSWSAVALARAGRRGPMVRGDQIYDVLYLCLFAFAAWVVSSLNAGVIYFWMKDLSQEFIKLSVIFVAMEICDKILTSFGVSALHSLCCSCTQYTSSAEFGAIQVASDFVVSLAITTAHAVALMSEAIAFSVAMNSRRTTLLALIVSFNFAEVKGTVFKKFDPYKLTNIVYQDIVERFHMVMLMLFVIIEDMDTSDSWGTINWHLLVQVGVILASELGADIAKHAVVGKFNVIRPGVYREYMRDLCDATAKSPPNTLFRVVEMEAVGSAAIFYRMLTSFLAACHRSLEGKPVREQVAAWGAMLLGYAGLCLLKLAWGFLIRWVAAKYLDYYEERYGKARAGGPHGPKHGSGKKES